MYEIKITSAEKLYVQSDESTVLAVGFDILKDGKVVASYNHGFDLATPAEDIHASLKAVMDNYEANEARTAENVAFDEANAVADQTIVDLVGAEIT